MSGRRHRSGRPGATAASGRPDRRARFSRIGGPLAWAAWTVITLATVWQFALQTGYAVVSVEIERTLGLTIAQIGITATVYTWTFGVTQFFSGALLDRFTSRPLLWMAMVLVTGGAFVYATAGNFAMVVLAQVILAVGSSFGFVGAGYIGGKWFKPSLYGVMFGLVQTVVALGSAAALPLMQWLLGHVEWRHQMIGFGIIGAVLSVLSFAVLRDPPSRERDEHRNAWRRRHHRGHRNPPPFVRQILRDLGRCFADRQVLLSSAIAGSTFGVMLAVGTLWGPRIMKARGADPQLAMLLTGIAWIGLAVGATVIPYVAKRSRDYKWPSVIGAALQLVSVVLILYLPTESRAVIIVLMLCLGMFAGVEMLGFAIAGAAVAEELIGASAAVVNAICFIVCGLLTAVPGYLLPQHPTITDLRNVLWVMPVVLALGVLAALALPAPRRAHTPH